MAKKTKSQKLNYQALIDSCDTGESMANRTPNVSMKLQAFAGSGKTHFALTFFSHMSKDLKPEETLMCIIDCDLEGQSALVRREEIIPVELRPRILRKVCQTPEEVNQISLAYIDLLKTHSEEYPNGCRLILLENEAAFYIGCRDFYSLEVHGVSEADLMLARQSQAISEGKKTLPAFAEGQMHSYKVINKLFFTPFQRLKIASEMFNCHFMATVLLREYTENYGQASAKKVITAAGRADMTDPIFDWILELSKKQRTSPKGEFQTKHIATIRKSRVCKPFQIQNPTQEKFWKAVDANRLNGN